VSVPDLVTIATLRRPRGNKGELVATPLTDHRDRFAALSRVFVGGQPLPLEKAWWHGEDLVLKFSGIDSISAAEPLAGLDVEILREERVPLPPGEYYLSDLMGCSVFDGGPESGTLVGTVTSWEELPGQVVLEAGGVEFPYRLITAVDLAARQITVQLPEGLLELNRD
jgi:16S rRNA processing protein RimM